MGSAAFAPSIHHHEDARGDGERQPAALDNFQSVRGEEGRSTMPSDPNTAITTGRRQRHCRRATTPTSVVLMTMTPVTAIPYAAARLLDDRKIRTISTTPMQSMMLMRGT